MILRSQPRKGRLYFFTSTALVFMVLAVAMYANLFFTLFLAAVILVVSLYLGDSRKIKNGTVIKGGVFGGLWLAIPVYIYFVANT